ncbi:trypsin-like peptidase domain-containing protein [Bradyrhizobium sp. 160]|uniref:trypsin-like serine peptidase n=1 Tax=Bradyrhizobium sp. 160 TaxID=2782634 RepID=UPI001FF76041|nr:trypsin-like peptidase domain-containing protein [Bradyrhizobium sp. 160]MCK1623187.1 trypsin-like peptidase domain-containing protein [Bradyrhizobium sp. 160]
MSLAQDKPDSTDISEDQRSYSTQFWDQREMERTRPIPMPELSEKEYEERFGTQRTPERRDGEQETLEQEHHTLRRVDVNQIPFQHAGKLFFTLGGSSYSCTAEYTGDPTVVLTAAHCVRDMNNGAWATNVLFVQRYAAGGGRRTTARCMATWPEWVTGGGNRWPHDYAFVLMNQPSDTGHLGMKTNWRYSSLHSIGYPGAMENGQYMQLVRGSTSTVSNIVELTHGQANFTFGASGGSMIGDLSGNGTGPYNYATSVNSHIYKSRPGRLYGPYFTNRTADLFRFVRNGCR